MAEDKWDRDPPRGDVEDAWVVLQAAGVKAIAGISMAELHRIVNGNPNYSDAERRMANGLIMTRGELVVAKLEATNLRAEFSAWAVQLRNESPQGVGSFLAAAVEGRLAKVPVR